MCCKPLQGTSAITRLIPGLPKLTPGLELANTFGIEILSRKQEVARLQRRFNLKRRISISSLVGQFTD